MRKRNFFPWIDICAIQINKYYYIIIINIKIFNDENNHDDTADCERQSFARLCFAKIKSCLISYPLNKLVL